MLKKGWIGGGASCGSHKAQSQVIYEGRKGACLIWGRRRRRCIVTISQNRHENPTEKIEVGSILTAPPLLRKIDSLFVLSSDPTRSCGIAPPRASFVSPEMGSESPFLSFLYFRFSQVLHSAADYEFDATVFSSMINKTPGSWLRELTLSFNRLTMFVGTIEASATDLSTLQQQQNLSDHRQSFYDVVALSNNFWPTCSCYTDAIGGVTWTPSSQRFLFFSFR